MIGEALHQRVALPQCSDALGQSRGMEIDVHLDVPSLALPRSGHYGFGLSRYLPRHPASWMYVSTGHQPAGEAIPDGRPACERASRTGEGRIAGHRR
ncbi:hypothetical protein SDC9_132680 [bioreactor metagenome]|uniref:Uncharacterized protein n=1 Tax=bioreactor metagenome TaxID=1076179 RepID=A0A645D8T6_9ZZZZ